MLWMRWRLVLASRGYSRDVDELEAGRHQVLEAGTTYMTRILEAFPCERMSWLIPSTKRN